ncbi:MAG: hypothetical protein M3Y57_07425 [Acidobacteriota bacterium]|nr:hypothetical protein [Acidobacteriota bacterium]
MKKLFRAGLSFLTFAGLTLATGMPSQTATRALETKLHTVNVSADAIPSAIISHSPEVAIDLPMPQGTHDNGKETNIDLPMPQGTHGDGKTSEVAIDLPMPQGTHDNGKETNIDLPMPQGTHGDGKTS